MDSEVKLYIERADNKILLAKTNFEISIQPKLKEIHNLPKERTFFNDVISDAYYAIFYASKAYILSKGIKTFPPEEHKKTYDSFAGFVNSGELNKELLDIYITEVIKAQSLLKIFFDEKRKRGIFTYNVKSDANIPYAQESINNAKRFVSVIKAILNF